MRSRPRSVEQIEAQARLAVERWTRKSFRPSSSRRSAERHGAKWSSLGNRVGDRLPGRQHHHLSGRESPAVGSQVTGCDHATGAMGDQIAAGDASRLECLVGPYLSGDQAILADYTSFFQAPDLTVFPLTAAVVRAPPASAPHSTSKRSMPSTWPRPSSTVAVSS